MLQSDQVGIRPRAEREDPRERALVLPSHVRPWDCKTECQLGLLAEREGVGESGWEMSPKAVWKYLKSESYEAERSRASTLPCLSVFV